MPFDQVAGECRAGRLENDLILAGQETNRFFRVIQQLFQQAHRLCRNEAAHAVFVELVAGKEVPLRQRQPPAVRADQRELFRLGHNLHRVVGKAASLFGGGKKRLHDELFKLPGLHLKLHFSRRIGKRRKLGGILRENFEVRILPLDARGIADDFDAQRVVHALANDVAQLVGSNQRLPLLLDLHLRIAVADGHFQIGSRHCQRAVCRTQLQALQHRLGGSTSHDVANDVQRFDERPSVADHFHS